MAKIVKKMSAYCPKCRKHTEHTAKMYAKGQYSGLKRGNRIAVRKRTGYRGKVKGQATVKKLAKRQKIILKCKVCGYGLERVIGSRTKKRLEIKND
jgi:large subunit ribosomal protein L44e